MSEKRYLAKSANRHGEYDYTSEVILLIVT